MRCGTTSAVLAAVLACFAYAFLVRSQQHQLEGERGAGYELGSGKMFDSIAPRYDLINKVISIAADPLRSCSSRGSRTWRNVQAEIRGAATACWCA